MGHLGFYDLYHWYPAVARAPNTRRRRRAYADPGVRPVTGAASHFRKPPRRGSPRLESHPDLAVGRHGGCHPPGPGLSQHLPGGRCLSRGVGNFDCNCCRSCYCSSLLDEPRHRLWTPPAEPILSKRAPSTIIRRRSAPPSECHTPWTFSPRILAPSGKQSTHAEGDPPRCPDYD